MGNRQTSFDPLVTGHLSGLIDIAVSMKNCDTALQNRASVALEQNVKDWIATINSAMPGVGTLIGDSINSSVQHEISIAFAILNCKCKNTDMCSCENSALMNSSLAEMRATQESIVSGLTKVIGKETLWRTLLTNQLIAIIAYFNALSKNATTVEFELRCFLQGKELADALTSSILG